MAKNCPTCGNPMWKGWCPRCHPGDPNRMRAYRFWVVRRAFYWGILAIPFLFLAFHGCHLPS
jgi:hypothetical protein